MDLIQAACSKVFLKFRGALQGKSCNVAPNLGVYFGVNIVELIYLLSKTALHTSGDPSSWKHHMSATAGTVAYHPLLKSFLHLSPDFRPLPVPGSASPATNLTLALITMYASPAYRQQALQVQTSTWAKCLPCDANDSTANGSIEVWVIDRAKVLSYSSILQK